MKKLIRYLFYASILLALAVLPPAWADDGNYYNFDQEDYWKPYWEWNYSLPGESRLPCNGGATEAACTNWAWRPWYIHQTDVPKFWAEAWSGRAVHDHALMMAWHGQKKNIHGGVFRREPVTPGHIYCFTMWARSGLDTEHPASPNARMQVGISPIGDYPTQVVLTIDRINEMNWSPESNSQYSYARLGVVAQAQASTITVFTRARPDPVNQPYTFWDEGSFSEIPILGGTQSLPADSPVIQGVSVVTSTGSAQVSWNTGSVKTLGQVLYRKVGSTETITSTVPPTLTNHIYLPLVQRSQGWQQSAVDAAWQTTHTVALTGLESKSIYEYVVVSYGYVNDTCTAVVSGSTTPRQFNTP